jgi:VWFA-related protein
MKSTAANLGVGAELRLTRSPDLTVFLLLAVSAANVHGQQTPAPPQPQQAAPQPKIAVEVKAVSVLASVRDKHGRIISSLGKDDFVIEEDGHPQTINYFARESDSPLRLGVLVDTSLSQRRLLEQERSASYSFLDHLLREDKDLAFLIHFDREVELLQEFTPSRQKLQAALQSLETPHFDSNRGGGPGGGRASRQRGGGTLLYDAIYLAAEELMSKQQGRKVLIILTDGVDRGSKETLTTAIATAQRADTLLYTILFKDDERYGNSSGPMMGPRGGRGRGRFPQEDRPDGKKVLKQISKETGGQYFEVSKRETVEKIYSEIEEDLRNEYSLGYTPEKTVAPGFHQLRVRTKQMDLVVEARDGYYAGP